MPRAGYKTITVKLKIYQKFLKGAKGACEKDSEVTNSSFLESLLDRMNMIGSR